MSDEVVTKTAEQIDNGSAEEGGNLVKIGGGVSRRNFLKILGASSAVSVAGCADKASETIFPYVKAEKDQIPGVAVWYRSTCGECQAGCGIQVRTREGRAVKIEGSSDHPINKGGLCALGQSSLQGLYDPDRVRQPLKRAEGISKPSFDVATWSDVSAELLKAATETKESKIFITGEVTGALEELVTTFCSSLGFEHIVYEPLQPVALCKASEKVYGSYGVPTYQLEKAEFILNFGSDFLETWVSPCEYARGWAQGRKAKTPMRVVHVEPRLSLTGANADLWLQAAPGTEVKLALILLKMVLDSGKSSGLDANIRQKAEALVASISLDSVSLETGISKEKIVLVAEYLKRAEPSLVLAGGTAASTSDPMPLYLATALLNVVLGNVGKTVSIASMRKSKTSPAKLVKAIEAMGRGEVGLVLVHGTNPEYSLPNGFGFKEALRGFGNAQNPSKKAVKLFSLSSEMNETAQLAHFILPTNHSLESWGDSRPASGINSLMQPAMTPVFDTKLIGDILIDVMTKANKAQSLAGATDFLSFLKNSWKKLQAASNLAGDFTKFWLQCVERGGYYDVSEGTSRAKVDPSLFNTKFESAKFEPVKGTHKGKSLVFFPFPSVKSFDGRAANKPWMQELPDPISSVVWDSWAEIHPDSAKEAGLAQGDIVTVRNYWGELNIPVNLSPYVHKDIVAVPLGQGHQAFGRYAAQVAGGNPFDLVPGTLAGDSEALALLGARVEVFRSSSSGTLVQAMGSDSQHARELARTKFTAATAAVAAGAHGDAHADGHGAAGAHHHEPKQMYDQRVHPLYRWGMSIDLTACTGCSACVVACYAENNIPVVGKKIFGQGREMSWLRIERYFDGKNESMWDSELPQMEEMHVSFLPMLCQHCNNAPCEPVCPVYATYHNEEGLNAMIYNRCVGTRYCSNNCSYKVRRFNWFEFDLPEPLTWQLNPDVVKRTAGVMEKCSFCVQRIVEGKERAKDLGREVRDGDIIPACVQSCPTQALTFGNLNDADSAVSKIARHELAYKVLDHHINTQPAITYLERVRLTE